MERLIIDCDPGVDDALAIMLGLESTRVSIERITTVDGNVSLDKTTANAHSVLKLCGRLDIPIHRGASAPLERPATPPSKAHGGDGLGDAGYAVPAHEVVFDPIPAVTALLEETAKSPGDITILAIGPLTNLAHALRQDPDFATRVRRLIIMGGAEFTGNITPSAEFNFLHDPEAAAEVFEAGFKDIVMVGLDVTRQVFMSPGVRELIHQIGGVYGEFITAVTRAYVDHYWRKYREVGAELCDPLAMAYILDPEILTLVPCRVAVETTGLCDGRSVVWRTSRYREEIPNCRVAIDADARRFFEIFCHTLFPTHREEIQHVLDLEFLKGVHHASKK